MKAELERIYKGLCPEAVPSGWGVALLKELSLLKISNGAFNDPKCVGSGYKLINIVDLYQGAQIRTEDLRRLSLSESEYKNFKVIRGDLFLTRSSLKKEGIAHCNVFLSAEDNVVYECHMMRVRPNPELVNTKYLQEFCLAGPAREYFISHGKTTTMTTIDQGSIGGLPVLLPPLPEQEKIAAILTAVDDKLDVIARQIEATKTLKRGLMQTLFSRGVGTQDADGRWVPHAEFKDSELGEIPTGWSADKLNSHASKVGSGVTPKGGSDAYVSDGIPLIRSQNVLVGQLSLADVACISIEQHDKMSNSALLPCDVLLNITGASIGRCAILPPDFGDGNVNQHVCIIRPLASLNPSFLCHYLNSDAGQKQVGKFQAGGNREGLNYQQIRSFDIPIPPANEQIEIAHVLDGVDSKLHVLAFKHSHFQTLKRGLMQKLLTGEWRVPLGTNQETAIAA